LKAFGRQPKVVVTDQDPAMKQAIADIFNEARHRLCMWHIMKKVAVKVSCAFMHMRDFIYHMRD
jgi:transposase-like protein